MSSSFSQRQLRDALGTFATGVAVITAVRPDGEPVGITANSLTSVSLEPALLLWCLAASSTNVGAFAVGRSFAVHFLAHDQQALARHFARRLGDKFDVDQHWRSDPQPPTLANTLCRFDCQVHSDTAAGDHRIIVGEILGLTRHPGTPLVFHEGRFGFFTPDPGAAHADPWDHWRGDWL
ncbi:MAG: flavin reductase family protein [Pseudomonadota bacterium]